MTDNTQKLVTIEDSVPLADSRIMAEKLGIQHHSLLATIMKYLPQIERKLGKVLFRIEPLASGQKQKYALLTEGQAYFVVTLCENTDFAIDLREELVINFLTARQEIAELKQQLATPGAPALLETLTGIQHEVRQLKAQVRKEGLKGAFLPAPRSQEQQVKARILEVVEEMGHASARDIVRKIRQDTRTVRKYAQEMVQSGQLTTQEHYSHNNRSYTWYVLLDHAHILNVVERH